MASLGPSLLQTELPQLSQPVLIGEVVQPCQHIHDLLWKLKQSELLLLASEMSGMSHVQ